MEHFLGRAVTENHHAAMVGKVALIEVAPVRQVELPHLPVRHIHAAHLQGNDARSDLEAEIAVDLSAHCPHDGHFVTNGFYVLNFVLDCFARPLPAGLHAGLPRPDYNHVIAHVQERVQHASAQALPVCQQQHHRRQAPDDPEHSQRRTHTIAHQRLPALRNELFEVHKKVASGQCPVASDQ